MSHLVHAVARVRSMEGDLLSRSHVERIISAETFESAYAVLSDLGYGEESAYFRQDYNFEKALEVGLYGVLKVFETFSLGEYKKVLTAVWDIQNIKRVIKVCKRGEDLTSLSNDLIAYGAYSPESLVSAIEGSVKDHFLADIFSYCLKSDNQKKWEKYVEEVIFKDARRIAKGNNFLELFLDKSSDRESALQDILVQTQHDFLKRYGNKSFFSSEIFVSKSLSDQISLLEFSLDADMVSFLNNASLGKIDGLEPLFCFVWKKERNARLIRSLLIAKRAGFSSEKIKEDFPQFIF